MGFPTLKMSLCGCSLQTGTKIIGWFHLIAAQLVMMGFGVSLTPSKEVENGHEFFPMVIVAVVLSGISSLFAICLLVGAYRERMILLLIWIYYNIAAVFFYIITTIFLFVKAVPFMTMEYTIRESLGAAIGISIQCYFQLIIYSYYREIKNRSGHFVRFDTAKNLLPELKGTIKNQKEQLNI